MTAIITTSAPIIDRQATWEQYLHRVENSQSELERVFFNCGVMWIEDMGNEGIKHARFNKLLTMILYSWFAEQRDIKFDLLGGCVLEKPPYQGAAPDEVLYIGDESPPSPDVGSRRTRFSYRDFGHHAINRFRSQEATLSCFRNPRILGSQY
jgi:Uma2 family endonuclease